MMYKIWHLVPEKKKGLFAISGCHLLWVDQPQGHPTVEKKTSSCLNKQADLFRQGLLMSASRRDLFFFTFSPIPSLSKPASIYSDMPSERTCPFFPLAGSPAMSASICHRFFPLAVLHCGSFNNALLPLRSYINGPSSVKRGKGMGRSGCFCWIVWLCGLAGVFHRQSEGIITRVKT